MKSKNFMHYSVKLVSTNLIDTIDMVRVHQTELAMHLAGGSQLMAALD